MGRGYVVDHCTAAFQQEQREEVYRVYVTDCLRTICENTARVVGGSYIKARYYDLGHPPKEDPRTGEEIIADFLAYFGEPKEGEIA